MKRLIYKPIFVIAVAGAVVFSFLFLDFLPVTAAPQAALFVRPEAGSFFVGSTFEASIVIDTKGTSVNTVEVELLFPQDKIQLASPSVGQSVIQLWPAPPTFSNRDGRIYFVGGIPAPGLTISQGVVLTLSFRVVSPGAGEIKFGERTRVLAHDGRGTNVLGQKPSAFYRFVVPPPQGPTISSPTHPDQEQWYRDPNPLFLWSKSAFADGYSFTIDRDPGGFPDATIDGTDASASFQNLDNGIWYFHLRERAEGVWGGVSHFVVKIDHSPPAAFRLNISPGKRTANRNPIFRFFTTDALSGLSHYEMKLIPLSRGGGEEALFFEVTSPYQAVNLDTGRYQVVLRALDRAGNSQDESATLTIVGAFSNFISPEGIDFYFFFMPWWLALALVGGLLLIFGGITAVLWRNHQHHIRHAFFEDIERVFGVFDKFKKNGKNEKR